MPVARQVFRQGSEKIRFGPSSGGVGSRADITAARQRSNTPDIAGNLFILRVYGWFGFCASRQRWRETEVLPCFSRPARHAIMRRFDLGVGLWKTAPGF
jgi:hypothetical protein